MKLVLNRVRLEIPSTVATEAWRQSQAIAIAGSRWQAYINQICLATVGPWLQEVFATEITMEREAACFPGMWELVNGSAVGCSSAHAGATAMRLVLIPTEAVDTSELRVPQEWIDIPSWIGDYYLAIEVDIEAQSLEVWGYTTHQQLKSHGHYDQDDRIYWLDGGDLIPDLNVLWVMQQLATEPTRTAVAAISPLPSPQAQALIQRLGDRTVVLPRLEVPFEQWAALLEQRDWLQQLCQHRLLEQSRPDPQPVQLSRWLQNLYESGWQSVESLMGSHPEVSYGFRQAEAPQEVVQRMKWIQLGDAPLNLRLFISLTTETDGRIAVRIQVLPDVGQAYLPEQLQLVLWSTAGQVLQSVQARSRDNAIQLRQFRCVPGTAFRLQVAIEAASLIEDFLA